MMHGRADDATFADGVCFYGLRAPPSLPIPAARLAAVRRYTSIIGRRRHISTPLSHDISVQSLGALRLTDPYLPNQSYWECPNMTRAKTIIPLVFHHVPCTMCQAKLPGAHQMAYVVDSNTSTIQPTQVSYPYQEPRTFTLIHSLVPTPRFNPLRAHHFRTSSPASPSTPSSRASSMSHVLYSTRSPLRFHHSRTSACPILVGPTNT